jgi:hypothetical protein
LGNPEGEKQIARTMRMAKSKKPSLASMPKFIRKARSAFPEKKKLLIISELAAKWKRSSKQTLFYLPNLKRNAELPSIVPLCILSSDWPGLSNSCIGVIHEKGWNLTYIEAFVLTFEEYELGVLLLAITIRSEEERRKFSKERERLLGDLEVVATGSKANHHSSLGKQSGCRSMGTL